MRYVYRCYDCKIDYELIVPVEEFKKVIECPQCKKEISIVHFPPMIITGKKKFSTMQKELEARMKDEENFRKERIKKWKEFQTITRE